MKYPDSCFLLGKMIIIWSDKVQSELSLVVYYKHNWAWDWRYTESLSFKCSSFSIVHTLCKYFCKTRAGLLTLEFRLNFSINVKSQRLCQCGIVYYVFIHHTYKFFQSKLNPFYLAFMVLSSLVILVNYSDFDLWPHPDFWWMWNMFSDKAKITYHFYTIM